MSNYILEPPPVGVINLQLLLTFNSSDICGPETQAFANFIKNHNVLKMYWTKCKNEVADEKRSRRSY